MDVIVTTNKLLGAYSLFLIVFGSLTNLLSFIVCIRKRLRKNPTFVFISHRVIIDILALLFTNIDSFYQFYYGTVPENKLKIYCNLSIFLQTFSPETSAWLLVILTIERCLSVKIKGWRITKFNSKSALIASWLIILLIIGFNFHTIFLGNLVEKNVTKSDNGSFILESSCVHKQLAHVWIQVTTYVYSIIPFILLGISNCFLIHAIYFKADARNYQDKAKRKAISLSVIVLTIAFIVFTAPRAITFGYYLKELLSTPTGIIVLASFGCLDTTYHSLNFVVLITINKNFTREFKEMIFGKKKKQKIYPENNKYTNRTMVDQSV